jgi:hypothetical protein
MPLSRPGGLLSLLIEVARSLLQAIRFRARLGRFLFVLGNLVAKDLFHCRGVGFGLSRARLLCQVSPSLRAVAVIRSEASIACREIAIVSAGIAGALCETRN